MAGTMEMRIPVVKVTSCEGPSATHEEPKYTPWSLFAENLQR